MHWQAKEDESAGRGRTSPPGTSRLRLHLTPRWLYLSSSDDQVVGVLDIDSPNVASG